MLINVWAKSFLWNMLLYIVQLFTWSMSVFIGRFFLGMKVEGLEVLKDFSQGNIIFAANHNGAFDPFLIGSALPRKYYKRNKALRFMTHKDFYDGRWYKHYLKAVGAYPVYPGSGNIQETTQATVDLLKKGEDVIIFPTGKRLKDFEPKDAKQGISYIAKQVNSMIVPVYISDTYRIGIRDFLLHRRKVRVVFGRPVRFSVLYDRIKSDKECAVEIMREIKSLGEKEVHYSRIPLSVAKEV